MAASIPRFLLPRGSPVRLYEGHLLRNALPRRRALTPICQNACASTNKPRVLEKPTKFNPPSHGRRLRESVPRHYGPELTQEQKVVQKQKQYPNMMPPEGTFMHWFLTNKWIHTWITMGTLVILASFSAWENWRRDSTFKSRLPEREDVLLHPINSFWQFWEAWRMSIQEASMEASIKRKRDVDDAQKRAAYRKAHGIVDNQGVVAWGLGKEEEEQQRVAVGPNAIAGNLDTAAFGVPGGGEGAGTEARGETVVGRDGKEAAYVDWEGKKRPIKKWLGIW